MAKVETDTHKQDGVLKKKVEGNQRASDSATTTAGGQAIGTDVPRSRGCPMRRQASRCNRRRAKRAHASARPSPVKSPSPRWN